MLSARAATDPDAAKLLEMFTKAEKMLKGSSRCCELVISKCRSSHHFQRLAV